MTTKRKSRGPDDREFAEIMRDLWRRDIKRLEGFLADDPSPFAAAKYRDAIKVTKRMIEADDAQQLRWCEEMLDRGLIGPVWKSPEEC